VLLVDAAHLKHVPGRETDVIDAQPIAEILSYGLLRHSFVLKRSCRELRDLTR
jgi:transposase